MTIAQRYRTLQNRKRIEQALASERRNNWRKYTRAEERVRP